MTEFFKLVWLALSLKDSSLNTTRQKEWETDLSSWGVKCIVVLNVKGRAVQEWRVMEVKFNSCSLDSNGKPKRLHTFWELKKPESKMKADSQNSGEKNRSEK